MKFLKIVKQFRISRPFHSIKKDKSKQKYSLKALLILFLYHSTFNSASSFPFFKCFSLSLFIFFSLYSLFLPLTSGKRESRMLTLRLMLSFVESHPCLFQVEFSSVQSLIRVRLFVTPWIAARQASMSITNSQRSLRLTSIEPAMPSRHLMLCRPLLLLPPIPPSIKVFSNESTLHMRRPNYWSFSFSISSSKEIPGLNSFRMDWLDLLVVQGTLKCLQHHRWKASILRCSAFFTVQLSHPYMTTGKTIAMTNVGKVMSLLFNLLSRLVITFLPRSKHLLISWLQSPSAAILEPPKIKSDPVSSFPIYLPWSDGTRRHDLCFLNVEL